MSSCIVLCKSVHHGNTLAVAQRIASRCGALVADPEETDSSSLEQTVLIGFGSGIYYGRFHRSIRKWLSDLPDDAGYGRAAFIYSTSGLPFLARLYHLPIRRALRRRGFEVVGEFACRGHDTWGPLRLVGGLNRKHPDDRDLKGAESFGSELTRRCLHRDPPLSPSLSPCQAPPSEHDAWQQRTA